MVSGSGICSKPPWLGSIEASPTQNFSISQTHFSSTKNTFSKCSSYQIKSPSNPTNRIPQFPASNQQITPSSIKSILHNPFTPGAAALARLKAYEGVPPPYDKTKRMVIPDISWCFFLLLLLSIRVLRLQPGHKYCLLGRLSHEVGWNHFDTIKELEKKRKERSQIVYERKKQLTKLRAKAEKIDEEQLGAPQLEVLYAVKY
ncbi:hypothetical protein ACHQM5_003153 [Ranunculus cassubicifolius]